MFKQKTWRRKIFCLLSLLMALASLTACSLQTEPEETCNFVQNSLLQRVSWNESLPITMHIHSSVPVQFHQSIKNAMKKWDDALGSRPIFKFGKVVSHGKEPLKDGNSVIYWREEWDDEKTSEQARTTIFWRGHQIKEADMQINAANFSFFTGQDVVGGAVDMESLMVHEFGHVLGLAHNDQKGSVMATHLPSAFLRRDPVKDDLDSLRCEY